MRAEWWIEIIEVQQDAAYASLVCAELRDDLRVEFGDRVGRDALSALAYSVLWGVDAPRR